MIKIKFSHRYLKFPIGFQQSKHLDVLPVKLGELSPSFLDYDTAYEKDGEILHYQLPKKGTFMILLLQAGAGHGHLWTTIRSQKGRGGIDKLAYYKSHIGEVVECVVNG